ncbi:MAG: CPBP family intramembrane metalloprotease [Candidatus Lokiarchaeota archaeon]|nr:CPBP family intramembrane metalloprotease [Candidatus Lokiarchaeota archaeon]
MREKKELSAFSLSKYTNFEMIMDSQFASVGAHQAKLLEKFEKNSKYIKNQAKSLKIISSLVMMLMPLMSILLYFTITDEISASYPFEGEIYLYSFFLWINQLVSIFYIFMFGLFTTSSLMSGTSFRWLQTLPVTRKELKKLGFATLFRNLSIPIIVMTFSFPIILLIITQNILTFLASLISSFLITVFAVSLLIIAGERFSRVFSETNKSSGKANILRIVSLVGFFLIAFGSSFVLQSGFRAIGDLALEFETNPPSSFLNIMLSFIPLPFAPGYFISLTIVSGPVPLELLGSSIAGMVILAGITFLTYKIAIRSLSSVATFEIDSSKAKKESKRKSKQTLEPVVIEIKTTSPVESYMHKDLISSTRDYQSLIFILMPLVYPIIMILAMQEVFIQEISSMVSIFILWTVILFASQFIPPLLVAGMLRIEESGSSTLASLPLVPRDQAKGKLIIMVLIQGISLSLIAIVLTILTQSVYVLILILSTLPISWTLLLFVFEMNVRLFGRMKYKYVLEDINPRYKVLKWISIVGVDICVCIFIFILGITFFVTLGIIPTAIIMFILGLIGLTVVLYIFSVMFPKADKLPRFETRGLLRSKPILGAIVILLLFNLFPWIATFIEIIFLPLILELDYIGILIFEFLYYEGFLVLLLFLVIPIGMRLPVKDKTFSNYTKSIGLTRAKPLIRNLIVGFGSTAILCCTLYIGATILGGTYLPPDFLFRNPNPIYGGVASMGWFIWIFMIRPGLWEEVAFRGVVIPLLSRKYKNVIAILISGVVFGLAHAFNIIGVLLSGGPHYLTALQVIYTILIGFSMGYMYIKSKSLLPSIIYHYLIDTVGLAFINVYFENIILVGVFLIVFLGVIPSILSIGLTKLVFWKYESKDIIINKR